jgi:hypothetical protein
MLHLVLNSRDRAMVSGDLLEEFRQSIQPTRGPFFADTWYIRHAMGFIVRSNVLPALLFGAALSRAAPLTLPLCLANAKESLNNPN